MSDITITGLTKRFDDVTAVDDIDLEVENGEFLVLVGPSGCGKSTTLRMIAGLEDITSGDLHIGDRRVNDLEPKERSIAMVFQNYALYPHMTGAENMKFGMKSVSDYTSAEIDERVREAAEILDIEELLGRRPSELSGGERQRVAIGRAIVREPDVFLLDEPLSNLDAKLRVQMRAELLQLHRELDATTLYVTHDQTEAMTLGDRVAVLNDGEIEQVDPPQLLYDYPATRFVAEFIGSPAMNILPVELVSDDTDVSVRHEQFELPLPNADSFTAQPKSAFFGIRPEDISLARNVPGDVPTFEAEVTVTEPLGESLLIHCQVGDDEIHVKAAARSSIDPGDRLELGVDEERLHVFDGTGEAIYHSSPRGHASSDAVPTQPEP
ncbi:sn-glycerol-3-phosphate ABC transporter ATP-binding protein UgpC [Halobellus sp. Atlit-38R]|jgi:multiple sugar transport system ATP-binding protein|uniref:ABC transporter ATP-binding protein n=1 Tax=Halobellus sp. Atlit-38R TaxID=2282131 RepID=UPI000EF1D458|nr:sn-glycerol-3-phosphate ABC transporter ATP-binding protein UgpC [Halobellus sp. Atlit-38R]RLM90405.1 sn-glycerol-3-phosphate ABC transporter ATP-binding protein UgpC [Halobellus sp. Atlit-38R]